MWVTDGSIGRRRGGSKQLLTMHLSLTRQPARATHSHRGSSLPQGLCTCFFLPQNVLYGDAIFPLGLNRLILGGLTSVPSVLPGTLTH